MYSRELPCTPTPPDGVRHIPFRFSYLQPFRRRYPFSKSTDIPVSHQILQPASPQTVLSRCGQCRMPISSAIYEISVIIISPQHSSSAPPCCRMHRRYNCRPHIPFRPALMPEPLHIPHTPPPSGAGMSPRHDTLPHNIS